jgi:long-chain acyl-CoA synthetase
VRSAGLFKGYHGDAQSTAQAITADGWFHTGDAGYLGDDGQLHIIDRMSNIGALNDGTPLAPRLLENKVKRSPYIKEAVAFGDRRNMVCMLIDIDMPAVGNWADKQSMAYTGHADLAAREEVAGLIADAIAEVNAELAREPALVKTQIRRFVILLKELDADDGVLTRMRKLRRDALATRYKPLVEAMYDGHSSVSFEVEVHDESDRATTTHMEMQIRDATNFAPAYGKRAA